MRQCTPAHTPETLQIEHSRYAAFANLHRTRKAQHWRYNLPLTTNSAQLQKAWAKHSALSQTANQSTLNQTKHDQDTYKRHIPLHLGPASEERNKPSKGGPMAMASGIQSLFIILTLFLFSTCLEVAIMGPTEPFGQHMWVLPNGVGGICSMPAPAIMRNADSEEDEESL